MNAIEGEGSLLCTGFGSAYVGSANLSGAALMGGLEWTVKFTEKNQSQLFHRAQAHFETLWQDGEFQAYDPNNITHCKALASALKREAGHGVIANPTFFEIQPKPFQEDILEQLEIERYHGRMRNLLVAATGTGKTVMAAFDYSRIAKKVGGQPRLLFVAHRKEILLQAIRTYRQVLRDANFGCFLDGKHMPETYEHLFATIQSVNSSQLVKTYGADYWQIVVVDECHHIAADTFDAFVSQMESRYLLGLTATPERGDGKSILNYFDGRPDGSPSVELRLWHALDMQLLAPFEYYACDDDTDYRDIPWHRNGEAAALNNLLSGNVLRAKAVVNAWDQLVADPRECKALVFCVSIQHAEFMAEHLNSVGIVSRVITGKSSSQDRIELPRLLQRGDIHTIVTVDLYNEGVDLPFVDTLLLLRPTQSATLFQQQIGRGLRLFEGKESCLVLDFVGLHDSNFRFDTLLGSITGLTRRELLNSVEKGFGRLPSGCYIQLQKQARQTILKNLKEALNQNWRRLKLELNSYVNLKSNRDPQLADFLRNQQLELDDIYKPSGKGGNSGWTNLKRAAGILVGDMPVGEEQYFSRRFSALSHIDDVDQLQLMKRIAEDQGEYKFASGDERLRGQMLTYQIDGELKMIGSPEKFLSRLCASPDVRDELRQLSEYLDARTQHVYDSLPGLEQTPLKLHAAYELREILTAVGINTENKRKFVNTGVVPLKERKIELLFVTLDKSTALHEGVAYNDYAISDVLFHWQTQNSAGSKTPNGRKYIESEKNGWSFQLFVRINKSSPYRSCGALRFKSHQGEKPMNIVWELKRSLPVRLFQQFSVLRP